MFFTAISSQQNLYIFGSHEILLSLIPRFIMEQDIFNSLIWMESKQESNVFNFFFWLNTCIRVSITQIPSAVRNHIHIEIYDNTYFLRRYNYFILNTLIYNTMSHKDGKNFKLRYKLFQLIISENKLNFGASCHLIKTFVRSPIHTFIST